MVKGKVSDPRKFIVTKKLPVAVKDFYTLVTEIGTPEKISIKGETLGYRLKDIRNEAFRYHFGIDDHIWVKPSESRYRKAWERSGCKSPAGDFHLDHLHSKARAIKENYEYVVLYPCLGGPNSSAGRKEGQLTASANFDTSLKQPLYYAEDIHFCKMWGCYQRLDQGLSNSEVDELIAALRK